MKNTPPATGSCNCGEVQFSLNVELTDVYICHCSICRKNTGGGIALTIVPNAALAWKNGTEAVRTWLKPGHDWLMSFCSICGSPVPGKNDDNTSFVPVSLLDSGHERLEVKHHIWVDSKATWEEIGDQGKQHLQAFTG